MTTVDKRGLKSPAKRGKSSSATSVNAAETAARTPPAVSGADVAIPLAIATPMRRDAGDALEEALAGFAQSLARQLPTHTFEFRLTCTPPSARAAPPGPAPASPGTGGPSLFHTGEPTKGGPPTNADGTSVGPLGASHVISTQVGAVNADRWVFVAVPRTMGPMPADIASFFSQVEQLNAGDNAGFYNYMQLPAYLATDTATVIGNPGGSYKMWTYWVELFLLLAGDNIRLPPSVPPAGLAVWMQTATLD